MNENENIKESAFEQLKQLSDEAERQARRYPVKLQGRAAG